MQNLLRFSIKFIKKLEELIYEKQVQFFEISEVKF